MSTVAKRIISNFKKRWKWLLLLTIIAAAIGFWQYKERTKPIEELTFVKPERGQLIKTLEVSGSVTAREYARMRFAAGGKVTFLGAKEGDWVTKGNVIAAIDQRSLQKNLQKSLNEYSQERIDWEQTLDDTKDRWLPEDEDRQKQKEQFDLTNTVLDVEINDIAITNTVLSSPFDGVLVSSPTNVTGVNLMATDTFELVNPNTLYFQAQVDELDIGQLSAGQQATLTFDAYPDENFPSSVQFISYKSAQTSTATIFLVQLPVAESNLNKFRIGLNGDATIEVQRKENVLSIPLDATVEREGKTFVKVRTTDQETIEKEIQTGMETDDRIEIMSGLNESDEVLLPE